MVIIVLKNRSETIVVFTGPNSETPQKLIANGLIYENDFPSLSLLLSLTSALLTDWKQHNGTSISCPVLDHYLQGRSLLGRFGWPHVSKDLFSLIVHF